MVEYRREKGVAVLEINNPPVNALSYPVRKGLADGISKANSDGGVSSIVIIGKGQCYPAGADIKEFSTGMSLQDPRLTSITETMESSSKPLVSAIHGNALGGGFEMALSSHYRVVHDKTMFGFPEVDIGILPAATGTQRFPRMAGLKAALDIIPTGRRFGAKEGERLGVVDKIIKDNLLQEAITFANSVSKLPLNDRRASKKTVAGAEQAVQLRDAAVRRAQQKAKGFLAPLFCIKSVMASVEFPYEKGLEKEQEYATVLFSSGQAEALRYAFFAQRAAPKWAIPGGANYRTAAKPQPIKTAGVVGAGTMGTGIAMSILNSGTPVILLEQNQKFLDKGVAALKDLYNGSVRLKRMSRQQADYCINNLKPTVKYEDMANVDLVIEAVFERFDVKEGVFRQLDKYCKPSALLCTNTSGLDIDKISNYTKRPDRVMGTHFFVPAYYMRLLENIRGEKTSPQTISTVTKFGRKIGKIPVLCGNCPGFIGNRMLWAYGKEANYMLEEGALPHEVDQVWEDFGFPIGMFKVTDLSGLDIGYHGRREIAKSMGVELTSRTRDLAGMRYCGISDMLVEMGRLGRKTGKGFYKYEKAGAKVPYEDDAVTSLILQYSKDFGIERRKISTQEILERCVYSMINEGFKILEEGIASKPEDIDTIWITGFGFPRYMGGPMFYANRVGLKRICDRVSYYHEQFPNAPHWWPSKLLQKLADNPVPMDKWASVSSSISKL